MPNATVRANARTLPEATNRRTLLSAIIAAGAVGATAALPAAVSATPMPSEVDRRVLDLWRRRARLRAVLDQLDGRVKEARSQIPTWARSGQKYLAKDETFAVPPDVYGGVTTTDWPEAVDLDQQPLDPLGRIIARPDVEDLLTQFRATSRAWGLHVARRKLTRALVALDERIEEQAAERERSGYDRLNARSHAGWGKVCDIENAIEEHAGSSILALGATLSIKIKFEDEEDEVLQVYQAALAAIRPQLIGLIAEDADGVLAEDGEAA